MRWQRTLVASFVATGAQAGINSLIADGLSRGYHGVERRMEEMTEANLKARGYLEARQEEAILPGKSNTPLNADGSLNMEQWDALANKACQEALSGMKVATNPSGACVCYNLPLLNNQTGAFEADLRLFQLSEPTGDFERIPQESIQVELSYNGASVSQVKQQPAGPLRTRQDNGGNLRMLQSYLFKGQVDKDKMTGKVTRAQLEALVMPIVTLKAIDGTGKEAKTIVSTNEAAFVAGEFANDEIRTNLTMAQLAVDKMIEGLNNGTVAFVLPGVQIMIFPIGLIITSIWLTLGLTAYGFGTYERYNFREAHKRRIAVAQKAGVARI
ncbi:hypothetical protein C7999DRAFT_33721 [Corynascus novoguineensis]|uniref:Uncharacterized protein n=1 Tax=Corynascus novoguineensis TaxID=1126955 RepID=A0AAN7CPE1_9PEZI|nr:hypothetical protein C7999DRAFT_33721 [Corynascus novoguineensis]